MYEPKVLGEAVERIKKLREDRIAAKANQAEKSEGECATLFENLSKKDEKELQGIGYCLSEQEKMLLVTYMFNKVETAGEDESKISEASEYVRKYSVILTEDMSTDMTIELYKGCQQFYGSAALNPLYDSLANSEEFTKLFTEKYELDGQKVMDAFVNNTIGEFMNKQASKKTNMGYAQALESVGVIRDTKLYKKCMVFFVVVCEGDDYRAMGTDDLYSVSAAFSDEMLLKLFSNMIQKLDTVQLRKFVKLVERFVPLVGTKGSATYEHVMMKYGLDATYQNRYDTWVNQYSVAKVFGEGESADFWYGYAGKTIMDILPSGCMTIKFNTFTVIESPLSETAYFYGQEYYDKEVAANVNDEESEEKIVEFLNSKTGFGGTGEYANNWRKGHRGSWKYDVMDYINKHNHA